MMLQSTAMSRGFFGSLRFARPLAVLLLAVTLVASSGAPGDAHAEGRGGLVNASAEAMIEAARARGMASAASSEVLASLAVIGALDDDAAPTKAAEALVALEQNSLVSKDLRDEISLMSLRVAPPSKARDERTLAMGIAPVWVIGPFRDTGGGLLRKEGPEEAGQSFFDKRAQYNYGAYDVHWREVPPSYAAARGIPLDLFVHPRKESCSIVASPVTVTAPGGVRLSVASSGQARLMWDRTEVAHSEDVHKGNTFDRLAGRVTATPGDHVVWVKTCSGAIADDGRVRLRVVADGAVMGAAKGAPLAATGKAQVAAARTPLADALDSKGDKLSQATVRALGASDDLRSPRAQGLIDAALQGKDDSDRLALAGWISPSAANRTGLLERARKAATRDNDTRVRGFVDRELAVESVRAGLGDWALAELERIRKIPGYQESTRDLALYLDAVASTGNEAGRIEAFRKLRAAFEKSPQTTPTVALAMVSRVAPSFDVNVAVAAEKELARLDMTKAAENERFSEDEHRRRGEISAHEVELARLTEDLAERKRAQKIEDKVFRDVEARFRDADKRATQLVAKAARAEVTPPEKGGGTNTAANFRQQAEAAQREADGWGPERDTAEARVRALDAPIAELERKLMEERAKLAAAQTELEAVRRAHKDTLTGLDAERARNVEIASVAEKGIRLRLVSTGTLLSLHRLDGPQHQEKFGPIYERLDELKQIASAREQRINQLESERHGFDRAALQRGLIVLGSALGVFLILLVVVIVLVARK